MDAMESERYECDSIFQQTRFPQNHHQSLLPNRKCRHTKTLRRRRRKPLALGLFLCILLLFGSCPGAHADAASGSNAPTKLVPSQAPSASASTTSQCGVLHVVESEVWDSTSDEWKGAPSERWTNEQGAASASPSTISPPEGFSFDGDWKIVVPSNGDTMGWEYQFQYLRPPKRKRIWLRQLKPKLQRQKQKPRPEIPTPTRKELAASAAYILRSQRTLLKRVQDNWNFKGLSLSIYKSLIFPESFGVGVALPLTVNFDYFDSHPELPSLSCGTTVFFPGTIMGFLSASIRMEWLKWVLNSSLTMVPRLILWAVYRILLPLLWTVVTVVLFPIRHRLPASSSILPASIPYGGFAISKPHYSSEISERVGCSISYRYSIQSGYEFRISYSHSYLPTLLVYQRLWAQTQQQMKALTKISNLWKRTRWNGNITIAEDSFSSMELTKGWFERHFTRLGVSTGYPIPSPPHFSCSAILSLSGLYFGINKAATTVAVASSSSSETKSTSDSRPKTGGEDYALKEQPQPTSSTRAQQQSQRRMDTSGGKILS